jgi:hypothetical protein
MDIEAKISSNGYLVCFKERLPPQMPVCKHTHNQARGIDVGQKAIKITAYICVWGIGCGSQPSPRY